MIVIAIEYPRLAAFEILRKFFFYKSQQQIMIGFSRQLHVGSHRQRLLKINRILIFIAVFIRNQLLKV